MPFDHYQIENNKVISGEVCYGRGLSFTINLIKYIKLVIIPSKGIIHKYGSKFPVQTQKKFMF